MKKEKESMQRLLLQSAMRNALNQRYERAVDPFNSLKYLFIGMFLIACLLGFVLIFALLISHPLSLFIICGSAIFLFILRVLTR